MSDNTYTYTTYIKYIFPRTYIIKILKSIIYINIGADKYCINKITVSLGQTSH